MAKLTVSFTDGAQTVVENDTVEYDFHHGMIRIRYMEEDDYVWLYYPINSLEYIKADFCEGISYA